MIVRIQKRENPYVVIDKTIINDDSLSFKARGIACYLLGKPDDWSISERHLVTCGPDGAAAVRSGLKELEEAGYLRRERKRAEDGTFAWEATLYETPQPCCGFPRTDNPSTENPRTDKPQVDNQRILSNVLPSNEELRGGSDLTQDRQLELPAPQPPPNSFLPRQPHTQLRATMTALNAELDPKIRVPYVDPIADYLGVKALIDADDDLWLTRCHNLAVKLHKMGVTIADLGRWKDTWSRDYRSKRTSIEQFEKFCSEMKSEAAPPPTTLQPQRRTVARGGGYAWS